MTAANWNETKDEVLERFNLKDSKLFDCGFKFIIVQFSHFVGIYFIAFFEIIFWSINFCSW